MMLKSIFHLIFIIQFPLICLCHDGFRDVILSPKDFGGKYIKFNRLVELTTKIPWEEPLKESAKIALSSPKLSKDSILRAQYMGMKVDAPPLNAFGDIVIMAKGKLKKLANESLSFEEIHDVCEYECQNNADKYLENVTALWMVERIRHRDSARGYRYDLRFTIVPISNENDEQGKSESNNLEERLRNQLKKTFILRDSDYPKYFQSIVPKSNAMRRSDHSERSLAAIMNPNHIMQTIFSFPPRQTSQKIYQSGERLNTGEYYKKSYAAQKSQSYYIPNVNHRYPIRFPDSRETHFNIPNRNNQYRVKMPMREEEKQETAEQSVVNIVDHRGAVDLSNNKLQPVHINNNNHISSQPKPPPNRSTNLFVPQPAIALPIIVPQMPMGLVQAYTIPLHLQLSTPSNQHFYQQQPDITTFRYPTSYLNQQSAHQYQNHQQHQSTHQFGQYVPPFTYIPSSSSSAFNKTTNNKKFKESELIHKGQSFSLPDPVYHSSSTPASITTERPIYPTQYSPKGTNYATAASIQVNSYDNGGFQPMDPPPYLISKSNKKSEPVIEGKQSTTEKAKFSNFKHHENSARHRQSVRDRTSKPAVTSTLSPITTTAAHAPETESSKNHQFNSLDANYDTLATRPTVSKRTSSATASTSTTEKPILKWLPKKHRNKTLANVTGYTAYSTRSSTSSTTQSPFIVTAAASIETSIHPTRASSSSTHAQVFRGRNRFYSARRNSTTSPSVTEKSTTPALSFKSNQTLKLLKRKAMTTTLLPISTPQPTSRSLITTTPTIIPTSYVTSSSYEQETSQPISLDNNEDKAETTASYELIAAGVETINTNSSNIQLYKAEASDSEEAYFDEREKLKIDEIATSIINHAKSKEIGGGNGNVKK